MSWGSGPFGGFLPKDSEGWLGQVKFWLLLIMLSPLMLLAWIIEKARK